MSEFLSIITINYNNADGLKKTLQSVASQTCQDYEHIIIDGGSTDGSVDVIKEFLKNDAYALHVAYWHSKKDKGIYDAMNTGIPHANGKYCLFLNSGDYLADNDVLQRLVEYNFSEDIIYSDAIIYSGRKESFQKASKEITINFFYNWQGLIHQNVLFKTSYVKENPYSSDFKIKADTDLIMKAFFDGLRFRHINDVISKYEGDQGISSVSSTQRIRDDEWNRLIDKYIPAHVVYLELRSYLLYRGLLTKIRNCLRVYSKIRGKITDFFKR